MKLEYLNPTVGCTQGLHYFSPIVTARIFFRDVAFFVKKKLPDT